MFHIDMQPVGRRAQVKPGENLLDAAQAAGVGLVSLCGGEGWCKSCLVRLVSGRLTPVNLLEEAELSPEDLAAGFRLACQAVPLSDVKIDIPPASLSTPQRLQLEGSEEVIPLELPLEWVDVTCEAPHLHDLRSDADRLQSALSAAGWPHLHLVYTVLCDLPQRLRSQGWSARVVRRAEQVVAVLPPETSLYGLAVDIGTTKLALYLLDLETGEIVDKMGAMNPQIAYGEDVLSRISYTREHPDGRHLMQSRLVEALNQGLAGMCAGHGLQPEQVVEAVVVGNTAMHHLFAGLPVEQLGLAPYIPAVSAAMEWQAREVGLGMAPGAYVYLLPNIAGYVGADHVAMNLSTGAWQSPQTTLAVDIGTNTEITLARRGSLFCCSCASGPAFEGAHIRNGMRAAAGAIERVQIVDGQVRIFTIQDEPPVGICGSGILDAVAEMRLAGILDEKGALKLAHPLVKGETSPPEFVLAPPEVAGHGRAIAIIRKDVNEIQLAKAAIRTGIEILLETAGISVAEVETFIIAGAFGSYIHVPSAIRIGMFPDLPLERFHQVGNAAGAGARQALLSTARRKLADEIARRMQYIELTTRRDFQDKFLEAMYL